VVSSIEFAQRVHRVRVLAARCDLVLRRVRYTMDRPADGGYFLLACRLEGARCTRVAAHFGSHQEYLRTGGGFAIARVEQILQAIERALIHTAGGGVSTTRVEQALQAIEDELIRVGRPQD
jgi:hypothetical protein